MTAPLWLLLAAAVVMTALCLLLVADMGAGFRESKANCERVGRVVETSMDGSWICMDSDGRILGEDEDFS